MIVLTLPTSVIMQSGLAMAFSFVRYSVIVITGVHNRIMSHCANVSSTAGAATSTIPSATAAITGSKCLLVAVI